MKPRHSVWRKTSVTAVAAFVTSAAVCNSTPAALAAGPVNHYSLESVPDGIELHNVTVEPSILAGKRGLKVTAGGAQREPASEQLVTFTTAEFSSGTIEAEIAGSPALGGGEGARGFVGIAFRVQNDLRTYNAFYLRPTNGRAEDQERRNHSTQYISHPDWPWFRLRKESPSKYESYVDLVAGAWTKIKIEVKGSQARFYVHDQNQPSLIVNDLRSGSEGKGAVALWIGPGTVAHFRDLTIRPE